MIDRAEPRKFMRVEETYQVGEKVIAWNIGQEFIVADNNSQHPVLLRQVTSDDGELMIRVMRYEVDAKQRVYQRKEDFVIRNENPIFNEFNRLLSGGLS